MMSIYCFVERPRELYSEAFMRGYVAAAREYPHLKSFEISVAAAHAIPPELREEVCCIPPDEYAYWELVTYAWSWGYFALSHSWQSQIAQIVLALKPLPLDEAFRVARVSLVDSEALINEAYAGYQVAIATC